VTVQTGQKVSLVLVVVEMEAEMEEVAHQKFVITG
jgi:hypothetical protein